MKGSVKETLRTEVAGHIGERDLDGVEEREAYAYSYFAGCVVVHPETRPSNCFSFPAISLGTLL